MKKQFPRMREGLVIQATFAYRKAAQHLFDLDQRWEPKCDKIGKLDDLHATRVAYENAYNWGEFVLSVAADVLLAAVRGDNSVFLDPGRWKGAHCDKTTTKALRDVVDMVDGALKNMKQGSLGRKGH